MEQRLFSTEEASEILNIPAKKLRNWRSDNKEKSPPWVKLGSKVKYDINNLQEYLEKQNIES